MKLVNIINNILLYKICYFPLIIWVFTGIGMLLMFKISFANITNLPYSIKYAFKAKNNNDSGKEGIGSITALMAQLACNLGIGNFAGSAFALYYGGPGVIIWFFILSFLSSAIKFAEVVLGHKYRIIKNEEIRGGTFYFIIQGLGKRYKCHRIIKFFAIVSALSILMISFGTSSMQLNQINSIIFAKEGIIYAKFTSLIFTTIISFLVIILLFGGLKKVGKVADILVPIMGILYIGSCILIICLNFHNLASVCKLIFESAFNFKTTGISFVTMILVSTNRIIQTTDTAAGFSAISQSNSNLKLAGQQGLLSFFDPFIVSTILSMGALAILVVGVPYMESQYLGLLAIKQIFISVHPSFEYMLICIAFLFGFTTFMAVGFAFEQSCMFLFGSKFKKLYVIIYAIICSVASFNDISNIYKIMDTVYGLGIIIHLTVMGLLANDVKDAWEEYVLERSKKIGPTFDFTTKIGK